MSVLLFRLQDGDLFLLPGRPGGGIGLVGVAAGGQVLAEEAALQDEGAEGGETRQDRHAEEHPRDAEEAAAHQDRHDDPEAGEARLVAKDLGADDVADVYKRQTSDIASVGWASKRYIKSKTVFIIAP